MKKRSYMQNCSLALALDLVGERWTLLMIREFLTGSKRYRDLTERLPGMGTNLLAERLKSLVEHGLLEKNNNAYALTEKGRALEPVCLELVRWNMCYGQAKTANSDDKYLHIPDWDKVALKALFNPRANFDIPCNVRLVMDNHPLQFCLYQQSMDIITQQSHSPDIIINSSQSALRAVQSEADWKRALADKTIEVNGSPDLAWQVLACFIETPKNKSPS